MDMGLGRSSESSSSQIPEWKICRLWVLQGKDWVIITSCLIAWVLLYFESLVGKRQVHDFIHVFVSLVTVYSCVENLLFVRGSLVGIF
jgi:hypothetical protein